MLAKRGPARYGVIGALALVQAFVLFSAVMWWVGSETPSATATVAPVSWTGVVYDVGAAGVNLRSVAQVRPDDARDTAARGARLALACGETGDVVAKGPVKTATWLKTTDGLFVSMLYVHVDGHTSIPSCDSSKVDGPLVALADPADPQLPPPPGTQIGGEASGAGGPSGRSGGASAQARQGSGDSPPQQGSNGSVPVGSGGTAIVASPQTGALAPPAGRVSTSQPPTAPPLPIGTGTGHKHHHTTPSPTAPAPASATPANPDTTPVG